MSKQKIEAALSLLQESQQVRTLPGELYSNQEIFELERQYLFPNIWFMLDHNNNFAKTNIVNKYQVAGESVLLCKDEEGVIRCFANVCPHRGSPICLSKQQNTSKLVCPYHGWRFSLAGDCLDTRQHSRQLREADIQLARLLAQEKWGLTMVRLMQTNAPAVHGEPEDQSSPVALADQAEASSEYDKAVESLEGVMQASGISGSRVVCIKEYDCAANWKLFTENFHECFHCAPNHPQLQRVEGFINQFEQGDMQAFFDDEGRFLARAKEAGHVLCRQHIDTDVLQYTSVYNAPMAKDMLSGTEDGKPIGRLMGDRTAFDGGFTYGSIGPFFHFTLYNDYAVLFRFLPIASDQTHVTLFWLMHEAEQADVEQLTWLWDNTIRQDIRMVERVQANFTSRFYRPGPYVGMEADTGLFTTWYRRSMTKVLQDI